MRDVSMWLLSSVAVLILLAPKWSLAADPTGGDRPSSVASERRIGVGMDIGIPISRLRSRLGRLPAPPMTTGLRIPFDFGRWQVEPNVAMGYSRQVAESTGGLGTDAGGLDRRDRHTSIDLRGGIALKRLLLLGERTRLHFGLTTGVGWGHFEHEISSETDVGTSSDRTWNHYTVFAGPVLGAEYFLASPFSVGFQSDLVGAHSWSETPDSATDQTSTSLSVAQRVALVLRAYF